MEQERFNLNQKLKNLNIEKKILFLPLIFLVAIIIRFYYTPYGIPLSFDGFSGYFLYALDITILRDFPSYTLTQSGWGEFLSLFFMNFHSNDLMDLMNLQRILSVVLSAITVIPIYFICKKFFNNSYSLIGASIFALDPRIIINSTFGISEPLYILAITLGILLFLNPNKKILYSSFSFFACATIIRPEGQFWFFAFSVIYFLRFRKNRKDLILFLICLGVFLLVLSPIVMHRIECCQNDGIIGRVLIELSNYDNNPIQTTDNTVSYGPNFLNGIKLLAWSLLPIFIIFVPLGLIPIVKQLKYPNYMLLLVPTILAIPIIYSLSIAPDTRYVYPLFPIFCVISLFGINWIVRNFRNKKLFVGLIFTGIIISSLVFLELKKVDYEYHDEAFDIAKNIIVDVEGVNKGSLVEEYIKQAEISNRWPISSISGELINSYEIERLSIKEYTSLENFIISGKEKSLTHLLIDENHNIPDYLLDVFHNEDKYSYLKNVYDSKDFGYQYHVKVYAINYDEIKKLGLDSKE